MFNLKVDKIGNVAVVHCKGRIVRSDAAFRLRDAVTAQTYARVILLDLSGVEALEGGGLGMLLFLQVRIHSLGIQLKFFAPPAAVRHKLERTRAAAVEIAGISQVRSLLGQ
jgi:anti-anti-sigma regulatory factor